MTSISDPTPASGNYCVPRTHSEVRETLWLEGLRQGHALQFQARGGSMRPTIWPGDILTIDPHSPVQPGDVILCHHQGQFLAHRLVARLPGILLTKGDNLDGPDSPLPETALLGKVIRIESPRPGLGSAANRQRLYYYLVYWLECHWPRAYRFGRYLKNNCQARRVLSNNVS